MFSDVGMMEQIGYSFFRLENEIISTIMLYLNEQRNGLAKAIGGNQCRFVVVDVSLLWFHISIRDSVHIQTGPEGHSLCLHAAGVHTRLCTGEKFTCNNGVTVVTVSSDLIWSSPSLWMILEIRMFPNPEMLSKQNNKSHDRWICWLFDGGCWAGGVAGCSYTMVAKFLDNTWCIFTAAVVAVFAQTLLLLLHQCCHCCRPSLVH